MAAMLPASGITLHGAAEVEDTSSGKTSAIVFKLSDSVLQDLKKASHAKDRLQFMSGSTPKLRIGGRHIDLTLSADAFRNELFASSIEGPTGFTFTCGVSHRGEVKTLEPNRSQESAGTDAALAALQNSLASFEQEKQSKQVNITNSILPAPKSRFDAAKKEKLAKKSLAPGRNHNSQTASPSLAATGTPQQGAAPTSAPLSEDAVKLQAMRTPIIHLLATKPMRSEDILQKTHVPKEDLDNILQKVGKQGEGRWQLTDRAYKDLDIWKFQYPTSQNRQEAIENAIKAYDRLRIGKEEKLWQMLLPSEERGKGKVLSRLHLGGGQANRGLTPQYQPSPMPHLDGASDSRATSAANTPRLGASTPRPGSSKGDVAKRLFSKDPKRARAVEEAKDKKRKDREAAASDREGGKAAKKQAPKKTNPNVKSAEFVHSSDEESGEDIAATKQKPEPIKSTKEAAKVAPKAKLKAPSSTSPESSDATIKPNKSTGKLAAKSKSAAKVTASEQSSDAPSKPIKPAPKPAAKTKENEKATASPAVKASKPTTTGKSTPQTTNSLTAPNSQQKTQRSPSKTDSRPNVPSPLGAARPRVASDLSERSAVGVQKVRHGGSETPKGLGITNGVKKQQDTVTSAKTTTSSKPKPKSEEKLSPEKQQKPTINGTGTPKAVLTNGATHRAEGGVKRKAEDSQLRHDDTSKAKHRKTDSSSSQSQKSSSSNMAPNGTAQTSPEGPLNGSSSDSASSVLDSITYNQGVAVAEKFCETYYPIYAKLYDEQAGKVERGEKVSEEEMKTLLKMHRRLEQMKREIAAASQREE